MRLVSFVFAVILLVGTVACEPSSGPSAEPGAPVSGDGPAEAAAGGTGWEALEPPPLEPRAFAAAFWTGRDVLVVGGSNAKPCPPNARCVAAPDAVLDDGAALDPSTGEWRVLAPAPRPLDVTAGAFLDGRLYLLVSGQGVGAAPAFLSYEIESNRWTELPLPEGDPGLLRLIAADDELVAYRHTDELGLEPDLRFDPVGVAWHELPDDPLGPGYDRTLVRTDGGFVLLALSLVPDPNGLRPSLYRAASFDEDAGEWAVLPDSEIVGFSPTWFWSAGRIVNPAPGSSDGGQSNNWGRSFPHGGVLVPPGTWQPLPDRAEGIAVLGGASAGGENYVLAGDGFVLHVPSMTWRGIEPNADLPDIGAAVTWAGDTLVVFGGQRWNGMEGTLLNGAWTWTPPAD